MHHSILKVSIKRAVYEYRLFRLFNIWFSSNSSTQTKNIEKKRSPTEFQENEKKFPEYFVKEKSVHIEKNSVPKNYFYNSVPFLT